MGLADRRGPRAARRRTSGTARRAVGRRRARRCARPAGPHGRHLVAAPAEGVDPVVGQQAAGGGDELAELDVGRPAVAHQPLDPGHQGLGAVGRPDRQAGRPRPRRQGRRAPRARPRRPPSTPPGPPRPRCRATAGAGPAPGPGGPGGHARPAGCGTTRRPPRPTPAGPRPTPRPAASPAGRAAAARPWLRGRPSCSRAPPGVRPSPRPYVGGRRAALPAPGRDGPGGRRGRRRLLGCVSWGGGRGRCGAAPTSRRRPPRWRR